MAAVALLIAAAPLLPQTPGGLDPTFGVGGFARFDLGFDYTICDARATSDGTIVLALSTDAGSEIWRVDGDGGDARRLRSYAFAEATADCDYSLRALACSEGDTACYAAGRRSLGGSDVTWLVALDRNTGAEGGPLLAAGSSLVDLEPGASEAVNGVLITSPAGTSITTPAADSLRLGQSAEIEAVVQVGQAGDQGYVATRLRDGTYLINTVEIADEPTKIERWDLEGDELFVQGTTEGGKLFVCKYVRLGKEWKPDRSFGNENNACWKVDLDSIEEIFDFKVANGHQYVLATDGTDLFYSDYDFRGTTAGGVNLESDWDSRRTPNLTCDPVTGEPVVLYQSDAGELVRSSPRGETRETAPGLLAQLFVDLEGVGDSGPPDSPVPADDSYVAIGRSDESADADLVLTRVTVPEPATDSESLPDQVLTQADEILDTDANVLEDGSLAHLELVVDGGTGQLVLTIEPPPGSPLPTTSVVVDANAIGIDRGSITVQQLPDNGTVLVLWTEDDGQSSWRSKVDRVTDDSLFATPPESLDADGLTIGSIRFGPAVAPGQIPPPGSLVAAVSTIGSGATDNEVYACSLDAPDYSILTCDLVSDPDDGLDAISGSVSALPGFGPGAPDLLVFSYFNVGVGQARLEVVLVDEEREALYADALAVFSTAELPSNLVTACPFDGIGVDSIEGVPRSCTYAYSGPAEGCSLSTAPHVGVFTLTGNSLGNAGLSVSPPQLVDGLCDLELFARPTAIEIGQFGGLVQYLVTDGRSSPFGAVGKNVIEILPVDERMGPNDSGLRIGEDFFLVEGSDPGLLLLPTAPGQPWTGRGDFFMTWIDDAGGGGSVLGPSSVRRAGAAGGGPRDVLLGRPLELPCVDGATTICLNDDSFRMTAVFETPQGLQGGTRTVELTDDTGYFWFFDENNVEAVFKVLDACAFSGNFWVFGAGLTDVGVTVRVRNTANGAIREYSNPVGTPFQPILDTSAFACTEDQIRRARQEELSRPFDEIDEAVERLIARSRTDRADELRRTTSSAVAGACNADDETLCITGDRFRVEATFVTLEGVAATARTVELTSDTGYFWFFDEDNVEVLLKILDACVLNDNFWLFAAGLTDVEVEIEITDTVLGTTRTFTNAQGTPFAPIQETSILPCG